MRMLLLAVSVFVAAGCALSSNSVSPLSEDSPINWANPGLAALPAAKAKFELSKARGACLDEANKIPVPPPSCVRIPITTCSGSVNRFGGGSCGSTSEYSDCDLTAHDDALHQQEYIFMDCMHASGWVDSDKELSH